MSAARRPRWWKIKEQVVHHCDGVVVEFVVSNDGRPWLRIHGRPLVGSPEIRFDLDGEFLSDGVCFGDWAKPQTRVRGLVKNGRGDATRPAR